jgi:hypothetical protein
MSTVLRAKLLQEGCVTCDKDDKCALYKDTEKLDRVAMKLSLRSLVAICDTTDTQCNLSDLEFPVGMARGSG